MSRKGKGNIIMMHCPITEKVISREIIKYLPFALIAMSVACILWTFRDGILWCDFPMQWQSCSYALNGTDIYSVRGSEIDAGFHAVPWGLVLGNVFYGGFLPYKAAEVYFTLLNVIALIFATCVMYSQVEKIYPELKYCTLVISLLSIDFIFAYYSGNAGGIICACLIISWTWREKHPVLSGILISLAMVKPQTALIVCFAFIIMKHIIPVIIAAFIDITAWFAASLLTHKGMFELIYDFLFSPGRGEGTPFAGIFHFMFHDFLTAIAFSMLAGIIFVYILHKYLPDNMPAFFKIYPSFMASTFWCYSFMRDSYFMIVPAVMCLHLMTLQSGKFKRLIWLSFSVFCSYGYAFRSAFYKAMLLLGSSLGWHFAQNIYELGVILIGILMCLELRKVYSEVQS